MLTVKVKNVKSGKVGELEKVNDQLYTVVYEDGTQKDYKSVNSVRVNLRQLNEDGTEGELFPVQTVQPQTINLEDLKTVTTVEAVDGLVTKTKTSAKTEVTVQLGSVLIHIVEYGGFITDVYVKDMEGKLIYKSKKMSISDVFAFLGITDNAKTLKNQIVNIRKQVKLNAAGAEIPAVQ